MEKKTADGTMEKDEEGVFSPQLGEAPLFDWDVAYVEMGSPHPGEAFPIFEWGEKKTEDR